MEGGMEGGIEDCILFQALSHLSVWATLVQLIVQLEI